MYRLTQTKLEQERKPFNQLNDVEKYTKPSLTEPEQTLSLRELLQRSAAGREIQQFLPQYNGVEAIMKYNGMKGVEKAEALLQAKELKKQTEEKLQEQAQNNIIKTQKQQKNVKDTSKTESQDDSKQP